jgi:predicted transcriptional regulator
MEKKILARLLGPLERAVMEVVWSKGEATVRDVHDALSRKRKIAYTTVLTVMSRLAQKAVLEREAYGAQHVYRARMTAEGFVDQASRREVERLLADYGDLAITHFLQAASAVHPDLMTRLRRLARRSRPKADKEE